jgi:hypothetical protein
VPFVGVIDGGCGVSFLSFLHEIRKTEESKNRRAKFKTVLFIFLSHFEKMGYFVLFN